MCTLCCSLWTFFHRVYCTLPVSGTQTRRTLFVRFAFLLRLAQLAVLLLVHFALRVNSSMVDYELRVIDC